MPRSGHAPVIFFSSIPTFEAIKLSRGWSTERQFNLIAINRDSPPPQRWSRITSWIEPNWPIKIFQAGYHDARITAFFGSQIIGPHRPGSMPEADPSVRKSANEEPSSLRKKSDLLGSDLWFFNQIFYQNLLVHLPPHHCGLLITVGPVFFGEYIKSSHGMTQVVSSL